MTNHSHTQGYEPPTIPIVVQVGFAGSRKLYDLARHPDLDPAGFEAQVFELLLARFGELRGKLGLSDHHVLCGVSQIAVGADTLFTRVCQMLGLPQRLLLPQHRDEFLAAAGADGVADFSPAEKDTARELLGSGHIIEERVVSHARDRDTRFEEANAAIVRESDVVLCLVGEGAQARPGGTKDLIARAETVGKPVVTLFVEFNEGKAKLSDLPPQIGWSDSTAGGPPTTPAELKGLEIDTFGPVGNWPRPQQYIGRIKDFASARSKEHRIGFRTIANAIIICHVMATFLAILVGKLAVLTLQCDAGCLASKIIPIFVFVEIVLLIVGLLRHRELLHSGRVHALVANRLIAEIMRSLSRIEIAHGDFKYLLSLPVPREFGPVLRTCTILLLRNAPDAAAGPWTTRRDDYARVRLADPVSGQVNYYENRARKAKSHLFWTTVIFWFFTILAVAAASIELAAAISDTVRIEVDRLMHSGSRIAAIGPLNMFAAFFPVVAVGALSWAAAGDLQGRAQTFAEMKEFLDAQLERFRAATSEREFTELVRETETRLLSENLNWYWRRAFASVG